MNIIIINSNHLISNRKKEQYLLVDLSMLGIKMVTKYH